MAAQLDIDLSNSALILAGEQEITSLEENSKAARLCKRRVVNVRNMVIRSAPWTVAVKRASLGVESTVPSWGWASQHVIPADFLRMYEVENDYSYVREGQRLLSDQNPLNIRYVSEPEAGVADPVLAETIATALAVSIVIALNGATTRVENLQRQYKSMMDEARLMNAFEMETPAFEADRWTDARLGSTLIPEKIDTSGVI